MSQGKISKNLFLNLDQNRTSSDGIYVYVYGVPLEREVSLSEKVYLGTISNTQKFYFITLNIIKILWKLKISFPLVILLLILTYVLAGIHYRNIYLATKEESTIETETFTKKESIIKKEIPTEKNISDAVLSEAFDRFGSTKKVIKEEIYQSLFNEFNNGSNDPTQLRIEIIKAIRKTLDPDSKLSLQYGKVLEKESQKEEWVTNWIQAIYSYQQKKQKEITSINAAGYLLPGGLTNEPLRNDIRDSIDPKFKTAPPKDSTPPEEPDEAPVDGQ